MVFVLLHELDVVFLLKPFSAIECQFWLEDALSVNFFLPLRVQLTDCDANVVTRALSNDKL